MGATRMWSPPCASSRASFELVVCRTRWVGGLGGACLLLHSEASVPPGQRLIPLEAHPSPGLQLSRAIEGSRHEHSCR